MTPWDREVAARTLWGEARGEGADGIRAVMHVLLNRVAAGRWGASLAAVCGRAYQFSCWNDNDPNRNRMFSMSSDDPELASIFAIVDDPGPDPTSGATHYRRVGTSAPWASGHTPCAVIGHHEFFNDIA